MGLFSKSTGYGPSVADIKPPVQAQSSTKEAQPDKETVQQSIRQVETELVDVDFDRFEEEATTLSEVQKRLLKADYYNALLQSPLFGDDAHPIAAEVEAEVREFVMHRLKVFLGMEQEVRPAARQVASNFEPEHEVLLKRLAEAVLKKPSLMNALVGGSAAPQQTEEVRRPQVQVARAPTNTKVTPQQAQRPAAVKPTQAPAPRATRQLTINEEPVAPEEPQQQTNGRTYVEGYNARGEPVKLDVTPQVKSPGYQPPPIVPAGGVLDLTGGRGMVDMVGGIKGQNANRLINHFLTK